MLENRLLTHQFTSEDYCNMNRILSRIKRFLDRLEAITPNYYDGLIMQMMGGI